jgi:hypothetical protein
MNKPLKDGGSFSGDFDPLVFIIPAKAKVPEGVKLPILSNDPKDIIKTFALASEVEGPTLMKLTDAELDFLLTNRAFIRFRPYMLSGVDGLYTPSWMVHWGDFDSVPIEELNSFISHEVGCNSEVGPTEEEIEEATLENYKRPPVVDQGKFKRDGAPDVQEFDV